MLMDDLHTYPEGIIQYYAIGMILKVVSGAAFFVLPQAHIRAAAVYHIVLHKNTKVNGVLDVL